MKHTLKEYRCRDCKKLLCKGYLTSSEDSLEVKCRGCGGISIFHGEDATTIQKRSDLIKQGWIPPEPDKI